MTHFFIFYICDEWLTFLVFWKIFLLVIGLDATGSLAYLDYHATHNKKSNLNFRDLT